MIDTVIFRVEIETEIRRCWKMGVSLDSLEKRFGGCKGSVDFQSLTFEVCF